MRACVSSACLCERERDEGWGRGGVEKREKVLVVEGEGGGGWVGCNDVKQSYFGDSGYVKREKNREAETESVMD